MAATGSAQLREGFVRLAENLLRDLSEVFPECEQTRAALTLFTTFVKGDAAAEEGFVQRCAQGFRAHRAELQRRETGALLALCEDVEALKLLDLGTKLADPDFSEESRGHLWAHVTSLATYAELYSAVPAQVLAKVEQLAAAAGQGQPLDVQQFGTELLAALSDEDLAAFERSLPDVYSAVGSVAALMGGSSQLDAAALLAGLAGAQQPNQADLQRLLSEISRAATPGAPEGFAAAVTQLLDAPAAGKRRRVR